MTVSAASIVGCSNDLLPEILIYLPVKTLLRLKLVCKKWKFIISDAQFAVNQFRKTHNSSVFPTPRGLFVYHLYRYEKTTLSLPLFKTPPGSIPPLMFPLGFPFKRYFQSCNGLLLGFVVMDAKSCCAVCNPTTGDFKVLPNLPDMGKYHNMYDGFTLVFNPFESHHYSVVAIKKPRCAVGACELYSFSSETERWEFRRVIDGVVIRKGHRGWFLNDTVYWIGEKRMHYYNVNSQEVGRIDLPAEITRFDIIASQGAYFAGGRLFIVVRVWDRKFKIFEFDNVNMKWSNPHTELLTFDHFGTNPYPLAVVRGKEKKDFLFVFATDDPRTLMIYDLALHKLIETHAFDNILFAHSCDYVPSLIPV